MTPEDLPPDLLALERELASRALPAPPAELRSRVLTLVGCEWPGPRPSSGRGRFVRFVAAVAAAALLAINLSASVANDTDWFAAAPTDRADVAAVAAQLRTLDPDLSDRDASRQAFLLHAAAGLTPAPSPEQINLPTELYRWETR